MPKKKMSAMAWLECYPFFLVWVPEFPEHSEILEDSRAWPSGVSAGHIIPH
jgi:hypothetical protein